jgi:hypothetical protein
MGECLFVGEKREPIKHTKHISVDEKEGLIKNIEAIIKGVFSIITIENKGNEVRVPFYGSVNDKYTGKIVQLTTKRECAFPFGHTSQKMSFGEKFLSAFVPCYFAAKMKEKYGDKYSPI